MEELVEILTLGTSLVSSTVKVVDEIIADYKAGNITGDMARLKLQHHAQATATNRAAEDTEIAAEFPVGEVTPVPSGDAK